MKSQAENHEPEDGSDDHCQSFQDPMPLYSCDTRETTTPAAPFYKIAGSFLALVLLHVLLALSFQLAQQGSIAQYAFSSAALLVVAEFSKLLISFILLWQEECCTTSIEAIDYEPRTTDGILFPLIRLKNEMSFPLLRRTLVLAALYCVNNNIAFFVFRIADGANINLIKSGS
jgi:hypothetical protein